MSQELVTASTVSINVTPRQAAWVKLSDKKTQVEASLEKQELHLQSILNVDYAIVAAEAIEGTIQSYKKQWQAMKDERMALTNIVNDKIIEPLMQYEKRMAPGTNEKFIALENLLLEKKKKALQAGSADKQKSDEAAMYTAHIKNQYENQVLTFKKTAYNEIFTMYKQALSQNGGEDEVKNELIKTINEMKFVDLVKFERKFVTNDEAMKIYASIQKPSVVECRKAMIDEVEKMWKNYENDKAGNINIAEEIVEKIQEAETNHTANTAINTLTAKSEVSTPAVIIGAGKKKIKTVTYIESEDTFAWALRIIIAFGNTPQAHGFLKAKVAGNITVNKMADALADLASNMGIKIDGLTYKTKETL